MKQSFSWSMAVLAGFGVLRRKPYVLLIWTLIGLVFGLVDQIIGTNAEILRSSDQGPSWSVPMFGLARGALAVAAMGVFSTAVYRTVLRPQWEARRRMSFGGDQVRLTLVWLVQGVLLLVTSIAAVLPAFLLSTLMPKHNPVTTGTVGTISALSILIVWMVLLVRLSLAAPIALAEGRWSVGAAWRMTRGHFWKILAVHLPLLFGVGLAFSFSNTLYYLFLGAIGVDFSPALLGKAHSPSNAFEPARLGLTLITAILGAAAAAILYAPAAVIYRDLKGDPAADQAAVFD